MTYTLVLLRNAYVALSAATVALRKAMIPPYLKQVLIGQLLGDCSAYKSSPTSNTRLEWSFGEPYMAYAAWVYSFVAGYCNTPVTMLASYQLRLKTVSLPVFNELHDLFYVVTETGFLKVVPTAIMELMTPVVLAHLLMGDGSFGRQAQCVFIYTNSFTHEDCLRLAESITAMGILTTVRFCRLGSKGERQYTLVIRKSQVAKLQSLVAKEMHPNMLYRIGLRPQALDPL